MNIVKESTKSKKIPLKALVLAGGKSERMGEDKSILKYHDVSQQVYAANLLSALGIETYISKDSSFTDDEIDGHKVIADRYMEIGPLAGILTAMEYDPNSAWLIIACDMPFITEEFLKQLIEGRNLDKFATAFKVKENKFAEPLIAIYEPRAYEGLNQLLVSGLTSPRKLINNIDIEIIELIDKSLVFNANSKAERDFVMQNLA